jgi:pyruvate formate lyase activating enzyme
MLRHADWYRTLDDKRVACDLCPVACRLLDGRDGPCGTRGNRDGHMQLLTYGQVAAAGLDPIEKKPLYHFHPGSEIMSIAASGCNLHCRFCQNWQLSQGKAPGGQSFTAQQIVDRALAEKSIGIAYTYSEPLVWYEFVSDTAALAREAKLKNVVVTNGYLQAEPLRRLLPLLDAANVDLKCMDDDFYRGVCKADLQPVLDNLRLIHEAGVHLEITNLVIPGYNDSPDQLRRLVDFVADLDPDIPLHFSAYHPAWNFDAPATPVATLEKAAGLAAERLPYVYLGNVRRAGAADTRCPGCGRMVVARSGMSVRVDLDASGDCPDCGRALPFRLA